jgi:hypothetical protein
MAQLKHILSRREFIFEQDFGMGDPAEGQAPPPEQQYKFLFLDPEMESRQKKYPDGSTTADYPVFSALESELEDWTKKNILKTDKNKLNDSTEKLRRENIMNIAMGKKVNVSDDDYPFIEKLKNAVSTNIFGKREASVTLTFTNSGEPTIDDIAVTFIPIKNKKP